jgi:hypothetical protein
MNHQNGGQDEDNGHNGKNPEEKPKLMTIHSLGQGLKGGAGQNMFRTGGSFRGSQAMFHRSPGNALRRK